MTATPVFVSRVTGLPLVASDGSAVGRVHDVVIGYPNVETAPPVLGFVAEIQRRQIFVNANRVSELTNGGARLQSSTVDMRRFRKREGEMLVRKDLFDRRVGADIINDVALRATPGQARTWEVVGVSLVGTSRFRRRRTGRLAGWEVLLGLFSTNSVTHQVAEIRDMHPADAATEIAAMPEKERVALADALDDEELADLLGELPEDEGAAIIEHLGVERAADVLEEMDADDAADLLAELPSQEREDVLAEMDPEDSEELRRLLQYLPDTAGGLMNPEPLILGPESTVAEALARIRDPDLPAAEAAHVFVAEPPLETPTGRYLGPVGYQRLLREPPSTQLALCLEASPEPVGVELPTMEIARRLASYDVVAVPVVDDHERLLGAVSVDDVLDHLLPAGWRRR